MRYALVLAASAAVLGHCIVHTGHADLPPPPQPRGGPDGGQRPTRKARQRSLPAIEVFRQTWLKENGSLPTVMQPAKSRDGTHIKIVVGVFSVAYTEEQAYRDVVRSTWMRQPGVCRLSASPLSEHWLPSSKCSVYATFVLGNDGVREEAEEGLTVIPIKENMDEGKSRVWFNFAAGSWPWATHIMKMDMDAFPHFSYVLGQISSHASPCKHVYGGVMYSYTGLVYLPKAGCGPPHGTDFLKYDIADQDCFSYAQGAMYFLTRELAAKASQSGQWWDLDTREHCYPEDVTTGHAIKRYGVDNGICVSALRLAGGNACLHTASAVQPWTGCPA